MGLLFGFFGSDNLQHKYKLTHQNKYLGPSRDPELNWNLSLLIFQEKLIFKFVVKKVFF